MPEAPTQNFNNKSKACNSFGEKHLVSAATDPARRQAVQPEDLYIFRAGHELPHNLAAVPVAARVRQQQPRVCYSLAGDRGGQAGRQQRTWRCWHHIFCGVCNGVLQPGAPRRPLVCPTAGKRLP